MSANPAASAVANAAHSLTAGAVLTRWLRVIWGVEPPLHFSDHSEAPRIAGGVLQMPAFGSSRELDAAVAHAAAHLVYSPRGFAGEGLGPIARTLVALLEDARVEALAIRELPGLGRLWRSLNRATPELGNDFESLLQRLGRALLDPDYDDPEPWVRKGVELFYLDRADGLLALRNATEIRSAATRLGHDIGQRRLQFNSKGYRPYPAYRDDHGWMWSDGDAAPAGADVAVVSDGGRAVTAASDGSRDSSSEQPGGEFDESDEDVKVERHYPEWDYLISRMRNDWCRVTETVAPVLPDTQLAASPPWPAADRRTTRRAARALHAWSSSSASARSDEGDRFDLGALVDWAIARRSRRTPDPMIYLSAARAHPRRRAAVILIDQSASSGDPIAGTGQSALRVASQTALILSDAFRANGVRSSIVAFDSAGRDRVDVRRVKSLDSSIDVADEVVRGRLNALRPGRSTRLGAALRHALQAVAASHSDQAWVIVLSDGEPHDIDIHDGRYLIADAREAVKAASRRSLRALCLVTARQVGSTPRRIFGTAGVALLRRPAELVRALRRLERAAL